jgi:hypothetical protein
MVWRITMDVLNCYVQPNTLKRKPFGDKEELKELKIWMVWRITMDVLNCYVQPNTLKRKPFGEKEELKEPEDQIKRLR